MMFKAYLTAELDKLLQFPEYSEVLLLDTSPPEPHEPQAGSSKEPAEPSSKRTRQQATKASVTKVQKPPVQEGAPPDPLDKLRGLGQQQAEAYNLNDLKEVVELSEFLDSNGGWELFVTRKDGNCLYSSFFKGAEVPEEYRPMHLRFQLVLFCCQNHGFCFTVLKNHIMENMAIQGSPGKSIWPDKSPRTILSLTLNLRITRDQDPSASLTTWSTSWSLVPGVTMALFPSLAWCGTAASPWSKLMPSTSQRRVSHTPSSSIRSGTTSQWTRWTSS